RGALGPNFLIQQGAKLVMRGRDVLEEIPGVELPPEAPAIGPEDLEPPEAGEAGRVLALVPGDEGVGVDDLAARAKMEPGPLLALLLDLEMKDRVRRLPGRRFIRRRRRAES
ncbi:MAG TPA: DNA-protecting protein DprA, partial [Candidatus Polarisedimenticolia bacterium]|nr:DNA-protecting protein DprA [Candidatus Polarisedimenticolia bacterium]